MTAERTTGSTTTLFDDGLYRERLPVLLFISQILGLSSVRVSLRILPDQSELCLDDRQVCEPNSLSGFSDTRWTVTRLDRSAKTCADVFKQSQFAHRLGMRCDGLGHTSPFRA